MFIVIALCTCSNFITSMRFCKRGKTKAGMKRSAMTESFSPSTGLVLSSFRRKPESSRTAFTPLLWIPAFAGMTVFWRTCQRTVKHSEMTETGDCFSDNSMLDSASPSSNNQSTMERNFCTHCGTALAGQVTCPNCGTESVVYNAVNVSQRGTYSPQSHVPDYLVWSIISVLYGGILGVIALIFSFLCRNDLDAGRYDSASRNSNIAFWCNVICLGLLVFGLLCFFLFFAVIIFIGTFAG